MSNHQEDPYLSVPDFLDKMWVVPPNSGRDKFLAATYRNALVALKGKLTEHGSNPLNWEISKKDWEEIVGYVVEVEGAIMSLP